MKNVNWTDGPPWERLDEEIICGENHLGRSNIVVGGKI